MARRHSPITKTNNVWTIVIKIIFAYLIIAAALPCSYYMLWYPGSAPEFFKPLHYFYIVNSVALLEIVVCSFILFLYGVGLRLHTTYIIFVDIMHYLLFVQGAAVIWLSEWIDDPWAQYFTVACVIIYGCLALLDVSMLKINPWLQNAAHRKRQKRIRESTTTGAYDGTGIADCNICLNDFVLGEEIQNTPCQHRYHTECLRTWLNMASTCPNCRIELLNNDPQNSVVPDPSAEPDEEEAFDVLQGVNQNSDVPDPSAELDEEEGSGSL